MATIRISRLPEIRNDRLSADDFLIINDGDIVTSKISFEEFTIAFGQQDIEFTGDLLYTGDVVFEGQVTGDFYNKDQVYNKTEINQIVDNLRDYDAVQDTKIEALITLSGRPPLSEDLGVFRGGNASNDWPPVPGLIPDNSTIKAALGVLEDGVIRNATDIANLELRVLQNEVDIQDLKNRVDAIEDELYGSGGTTPPTNPNPGDSVTGDIIIIFDTLAEHNLRLTWLETAMGGAYNDAVPLPGFTYDYPGVDGSAGPSTTYSGDVFGYLNGHHDAIANLRLRADYNDEENRALITLSGLPRLSVNLGTFVVPTANYSENQVFPSPHVTTTLNNKNNKEAFQNIVDEVATRSPIINPVFEQKITGEKEGSVIPFYYSNPAAANASTGSDGTFASTEGAFAYTRLNSGGSVAPRAHFSDGSQWIDLLSSLDKEQILSAVGIQLFQNDDQAGIGGVGVGFVYAQGATWAAAKLRTRGVNAVVNP